MKQAISERVKHTQPSITLAITAKAKSMIQAGADVVGFGAGEPDFDTPDQIKEAAIAAIRAGHTKYTPANGLLELREKIVEKFKNDNNLDYTADQVIVSSGAKHCLSTAFQSILNKGDEVIVPSPYWVSYPEIVRVADGEPIFVETQEKNDFKITAEEFKNSITSKTKAIYINSPSNPVGSIYSKKELTALAEVAVANKIYVISDEIYEKLIYDDEKHISIASLNPEIKDWTIVVNGMSKSYSMTGWRLGYSAGPKHVIEAMNKIQGHAVSHPSSISQHAAIAALDCPDSVIEDMLTEYDKRRKYCIQRLDKIPALTYIPPKGAFYIFINVSSLYGKTYKGEKITGSLKLAELLLDHYEVALVPGIGFGADDFVRISYATDLKTIEKGLDRMESFIEEVK